VWQVVHTCHLPNTPPHQLPLPLPACPPTHALVYRPVFVLTCCEIFYQLCWIPKVDLQLHPPAARHTHLVQLQCPQVVQLQQRIGQGSSISSPRPSIHQPQPRHVGHNRHGVTQQLQQDKQGVEGGIGGHTAADHTSVHTHTSAAVPCCTLPQLQLHMVSKQQLEQQQVPQTLLTAQPKLLQQY